MKSFKKLLSSAVVASLFGITSSSVAASVIIDNFTTAQGPLSVTSAVTGSMPLVTSGWDYVTSTDDGIIGGVRELKIDKTFGSSSQGIAVNVFDSQLNYSVDSLAKGTGYLRWDGVADNAISFGLNKDISNENTLLLMVDFSDNGYPFTLSLYTDESKYSTFHGTADSVGDIASGSIWNSPHEFSFNLDIFRAPFGSPSSGVGYVDCGVNGCVDLSQLNAIEAVIDPNASRTALDLTLSGVKVVSEPEGGVLALLGISSLAFLRRVKSVK